jgi:hypothetical protein
MYLRNNSWKPYVYIVFTTGRPLDIPQALVSFKKYMPPPLPYIKVNICPLPLPHFASIFSLICDCIRFSD